MIRITFFENPQDTTGTTIEAQAGASLMKAAIAADIEGVAADCGGTLSCATCHVMVRAPWADQLPPMTDDEDSMLDYAASPREANSRLSCQLVLTDELDGMEIDLPATQY
jgi:ferredoxin, 2Fe-2S